MVKFQDIIGHEDAVKHLQNSILSGKVSHSYIFCGEAGAGKKTLASVFAAALLCERHGKEACGECDSCKKAAGKNHPDIIYLTHEKENLISVDEIRTQIVGDIGVKPYEGGYKIYIIPDAQFMNPQAQNALLKSIEEPPEYAVMILLTTNIDALLPTIRSRCVRLDLHIVDDELIKNYLMDHLHIPDYQAALDTSFAQGNIGKAEKAATSADFQEMTQNVIWLMKNIDTMEFYEFAESIKTFTSDKQKIENYLELFQFWFRDVLMFKATREIDKLVFKQEIKTIRQKAREYSYEGIENILEALEKTRLRLAANVNTELSLELLFLTIREK